MQLYEHVKELDNRLMPLSRTEFLKLVFNLAENLKIPHRFNKEKGLAGKYFFTVLKINIQILFYELPSQPALLVRLGLINHKFNVSLSSLSFFKISTNSYLPGYNADETGVSNVHKNNKVISIKGKKQVGKLTTAERGRKITLTFAMNVTGHFISPLFIFPRKKMDRNGRLMIGAPPNSIAVPYESGWMNGEVFLQWLHHFKQHVQPTETNPVLLILDGHASHKELAVIEYSRKHHIHMLSTPPHTTHKLQPLDRTFFKPFKGQLQVQHG